MHRNYKSGATTNKSVSYNKDTNSKIASKYIINNNGEVCKVVSPKSSMKFQHNYVKTKVDFSDDYEYY
jgi:hypothetical protein